MKRLVAILLAAILVLSMSIPMFAVDETTIPIDEEHIGAGGSGVEELTLADGSVTADGITLFCLYLPERVPIGETVTVHIKGSADDNFRVWLLAAEDTQSTFSNQWKASDNGFTSGEFEKYIELTAEDFDGVLATEADTLAFKAPSYDATLTNLKIDFVSIYYGPIADIEGDAAANLQPYVDALDAAMAAANSASDDAALEAALADAQAAAASIEAEAGLGFPSVTEILNNANKTVRDIQAMVNSAAAEDALAELQSYIDTVNNALATAESAGSDVAAVEQALADAQAASEYVEGVAADSPYDTVLSASRELKVSVRKIESLLEESKQLKAEEDAKAAEEAAAAKQRTMIIVIVVVAVVVVIVVVVVILGVLKKKKK